MKRIINNLDLAKAGSFFVFCIRDGKMQFLGLKRGGKMQFFELKQGGKMQFIRWLALKYVIIKTVMNGVIQKN